MGKTGMLVQKDYGEGRIGVILNRAPVNALSADLLMQVAQTLRDLDRDPECRAVIFLSAFKVFSAGLDLKEAQKFDLPAQHDIVAGFNHAFHAMFGMGKPTVVGISGAAIAGGCFFALASDYRIATTGAKLGLAEVRVGATFPIGPMEVARAMLSPNDMRRLMLTGQPMQAEAAHEAGILDELVEPDDLETRALEMASELAALPPRTYAAIKQQMRGGVLDRIERAMAHGANSPAEGWFSDETRAAMARMVG
ncbi:MAG: enoyl-CoA hydratase/isomerase family protein [Rhodobacteraceae bacterium]|nr:enoyl-CoA hydratase/isomerase family protein [Paracoccaceae bacterium]